MRRHGLIHLLNVQWRSMRGLEQPPYAPSVVLDMPDGDRVVGLEIEVEDDSVIKFRRWRISLGRVRCPLLVSVAIRMASLLDRNISYVPCR